MRWLLYSQTRDVAVPPDLWFVRHSNSTPRTHMHSVLPTQFVDLVQDALLKSFWRRDALLNFLRRHRVPQSLLSSWDSSESKRKFIARLIPTLESSEEGHTVLRHIGLSLSTQQ